MPGARLIEAERPASAINHVVDGAFNAKRVDGRDLLDAAKLYEVEVAGVKPDPSPAASAQTVETTTTIGTEDASVTTTASTDGPDFVADQGNREENEE